MIINIEGDLLEAQKEFHLDYICHQVNCQGAMNSGIAKHIRNTYPQVYDNYIHKVAQCDRLGIYPLGDIQFVPLYDDYEAIEFHPHCVNMFSQNDYGYDGKQYTSYDAFWGCLLLIKQHIQKDAKIGFPYGIGCVRGGANWQVILKMIETVFENHYVYIVKLGDTK
jgi:O-acetyl-ADP-ribose deacetylase (regulator of RNase III)